MHGLCICLLSGSLFHFSSDFCCIFIFSVRTGKTLIAKTLARFVNVPFVIADATSLTQASSVINFFLHHFMSTYGFPHPFELSLFFSS